MNFPSSSSFFVPLRTRESIDLNCLYFLILTTLGSPMEILFVLFFVFLEVKRPRVIKGFFCVNIFVESFSL